MRGTTLLLLGVLGCQAKNADPGTHSAAPRGSASAVGTPGLGALSSAELRRDSAAISVEALSQRDLPVRRAAARALSRIADARSAELSLLALSDEDPEVSTWGAYGLGATCRGREAKTVRALSARAASLPADNAGTLLASPIEAVADALGRCGGSEAESTLRAWLRGPKARAEAAALGLARLASNVRLDDTTLVALLDAADRPENPLSYPLFPLTRANALNASTADRAREIAARLVTEPAPRGELAVRVLAHSNEAGAQRLSELLASSELSPSLRAQGARELTVQRWLWAAFEHRVVPSEAELLAAEYGAFASLLDALQAPVLSSGSKLQTLAELPSAASDSNASKRRKVHLRCTAAALLAGSNPRQPLLVACDPESESVERDLATLRVLGRASLKGARKVAYSAFARDARPRVREAALALLAEHQELPEAYQLLAEGLSASALGVVASAAYVLASYPQRATKDSDAQSGAPNPDASIVKALGQAYIAAAAKNSVEVQSALLDAIGALQILSLKEVTNRECGSDKPTLREHAQRALRLLGEQSRRCDAFQPPTTSAPLPPAQRATLSLETDAGTVSLHLDPSFAPSAVARVVGLAQAGFYDGLTVHRVVPGFVAQFGDPGADSYGGDDQPPLRCETSPIAFQPGAVGVALSGRDTGSSQLFVTLGRYPNLDGQYAWLGQAGPGWERLAAGDRILHARITFER